MGTEYLDNQSLEEAFPQVDPQFVPFGSRVLVQIKQPVKRTRSGIELPSGEKSAERDNTQVAKVIALGPLAYRNRNTMELWPEGEWVKAGQFVRVPRYGGDRFYLPNPSDRDIPALFVIFDDLNITGAITGDPLVMKAFV
jgi:co-chaperonin GroES (HSP10)